jgi:glycosidase
MAEMVPAAFWNWATDKVKYRYPELIFIGEVYNPAEYRNYVAAGFDYLYDKVGMYDTLKEVMCGRQSAHAITGAWQQTNDISDHMLYFLENHDEQRIASDFFAGDARKGIPALVVSALLQQNPLMIYFGQEYGERGMDEEGFSGRDGRTTIFDYWSVDTMVRASKKQYTLREKHLYDTYVKVMNIAQQEKAVKQGVMFDLMYVNGHLQRQFAFLRKADNEVLLVVVNFEDQQVLVNVNIPAHAFGFLKMKEKEVTATDLLTKQRQHFRLACDETVPLELEPLGAKVLRFKV